MLKNQAEAEEHKRKEKKKEGKKKKKTYENINERVLVEKVAATTIANKKRKSNHVNQWLN